MTSDDKPPVRMPRSFEHGPTKPPSERSGIRSPSERSDTIRLTPTELTDLLEGAIRRVSAELQRQWRDDLNRAVASQVAGEEIAALSAELTVSRSQSKALATSRRKLIYAIATLALTIAIGVVERIFNRPQAQAVAPTASQIIDEESKRVERINAAIRALEAERDTTAK